MTRQSNFKLILKGPGVTIDQAISKDLADQIALMIFTHGKVDVSVSSAVKIKQDGGASLQSAKTEDPELSLREFLDACEAKRNVEIIAAIGAFLKEHQGKTSFTKADVVAGFEDASEPAPRNIQRDIGWTIKTGWIAHKSDDKNAYYVTKSGNDAIKAKFPVDLKKKTQVRKGGKKKKSKDTVK
jgi:hypothetical protein